jgi:hypothetical protein
VEAGSALDQKLQKCGRRGWTMWPDHYILDLPGPHLKDKDGSDIVPTVIFVYCGDGKNRAYVLSGGP